MGLSALTINPVSEEGYMRMGFEDNICDGQIGQIDFGKDTADLNNCFDQEDPNSQDDLRNSEDDLRTSQDDLRDGNNNSSPTLFREAEIVGRGRGLVAKVNLNICITNIAIISLIMIRIIIMSNTYLMLMTSLITIYVITMT